MYYQFSFSGRYNIQEDSLQKLDSLEWVSILNENRFDIARDIAFELQRALPPSVNVQSDITFREGSISWDGVIVVLDWMARLADSVDFVTMIVSLLPTIIIRVLRRFSPITIGTNAATDVKLDTRQIDKHQLSQALNQQSSNLNRFTILTSINTVLLIILLLIQFTNP